MADPGAPFLFRQFIDAVNSGNLLALDHLVAEDLVDPTAEGWPPGREGMKAFITALRAAFPDLHMTFGDLLGGSTRAAARLTIQGTHHGTFLGIPPTGKRVTLTAIGVIHVGEGKILEHWGFIDTASLRDQLGVALPTDSEGDRS